MTATSGVTRTWRSLLVAVSVLCGLSAAASAQLAVQSGLAIEGITKEDEQGAVYAFDAPEAGMLSVVLRGAGDVYVEVRDGDGVLLPGGYSDQDLDGDVGAEQAVVVLGEPGRVRIHVHAHGAAAAFTLVPGFVASPKLANRDADSRPKGAIPLPVGGSVTDTVVPGRGDRRDVFRLEGDGLVVVSTTSTRGDVWLNGIDATPVGGDGLLDDLGEMFGMGGDDGWYEPGYSELYSDYDFGGDVGREGFVVYLREGVPQYVSVTSADGEPLAYTITCTPLTGGAGVKDEVARDPARPDEAPSDRDAERRAPRAPH